MGSRQFLDPIRLLSVTTTQRDALTVANGDAIYNSTVGAVQVRAGGAWLTVGAANSLATDTLWDAIGDIVVGTGADTAGKQTVGTVAGTALVADPIAIVKLSWNNPLSVADVYAGTTGALASTYNRATQASSAAGTAQTSGTLYLYAVWLPKGITVSSLTFWAGTTAGASNTHTWAGLYSSGTRTNLAISADDTTAAWTASTSRTFAMTTPWQTSVAAMNYVGLCLVGGTIPTIESITGLLTAGSRAATPRPDIVTTLTGQTTPVTTTPGVSTTFAQHAYCEVS